MLHTTRTKFCFWSFPEGDVILDNSCCESMFTTLGNFIRIVLSRMDMDFILLYKSTLQSRLNTVSPLRRDNRRLRSVGGLCSLIAMQMTPILQGCFYQRHV